MWHRTAELQRMSALTSSMYVSHFAMADAPDSSVPGMSAGQGFNLDTSLVAAAPGTTTLYEAVHDCPSFDDWVHNEPSPATGELAYSQEVLELEPPELDKLLTADGTYQDWLGQLSRTPCSQSGCLATGQQAFSAAAKCFSYPDADDSNLQQMLQGHLHAALTTTDRRLTAAGLQPMPVLLGTAADSSAGPYASHSHGLYVAPGHELQSYGLPTVGQCLMPDSDAVCSAASEPASSVLMETATAGSCQPFLGFCTSASAAGQQIGVAAPSPVDLAHAGSLESSNTGFMSPGPPAAQSAGQGTYCFPYTNSARPCANCQGIAAEITRHVAHSRQHGRLMLTDRQQLVVAIIKASRCANKCLLAEQLPSKKSAVRGPPWWLTLPKARAAEPGRQRNRTGTTLARNFNFNVNSPIACSLEGPDILSQFVAQNCSLKPFDTSTRHDSITGSAAEGPEQTATATPAYTTTAPLYSVISSVVSTDASVTGIALLRPACTYAGNAAGSGASPAAGHTEVTGQTSNTQSGWIPRGVKCSKRGHQLEGQLFDVFSVALFYDSGQTQGQGGKRRRAEADC